MIIKALFNLEIKIMVNIMIKLAYIKIKIIIINQEGIYMIKDMKRILNIREKLLLEYYLKNYYGENVRSISFLINNFIYFLL